MKDTILRWTLVSLFVLVTAAFATAVLVIFRAREVALPTRGGISPSEMAGPLIQVTGISFGIGILGLVAVMTFWLLRTAPRTGFAMGSTRAAGASLVAVPLLLFSVQMIGLWRVDQFFLGDPLNQRSTPPPGQVPTPTPVRAPTPAPSAAPWPVPQYPELTGPNVVTFPPDRDFTIRNGTRFVMPGTRGADGVCSFRFIHQTRPVSPGDPIQAGRVLAHDLDSCRYLYEEGEYVGPPLDTLPRASPTHLPLPAAPYSVPRKLDRVSC